MLAKADSAPVRQVVQRIEAIGQRIDGVRSELALLGDPPPARNQQDLASWRAKRQALFTKRDELMAEFAAAQKQYEDTLGIGAYFGGTQGDAK